MNWTVHEMKRLDGKIALVTGANSGLGLETTRELASKGAHVIMACRNLEKAEVARQKLEQDYANEISLDILSLNLANLESIRIFAKEVIERYPCIDLLFNNAGIMNIPYTLTDDGFEMQLGTNHLGHFALTGLLLKPLLLADDARVITVSSLAHGMGKIDFEDLHCKKKYKRWPSYGQSKLANLLFAYELQRRFERADKKVISVAVHPGYSATNLQMVGSQMKGSKMMERIWRGVNAMFAQDPQKGALPSLYAATSSDIEGGDFIGPNGFQEIWGYPKKVKPKKHALDEEVASQLWSISEELTGVFYKELDEKDDKTLL